MRLGQRPDDRSPADLAVRLFGGVRVTWRGRNVALRSLPAQALVALLVLARGPLSREVIATEIWPDGGARSPARLRQVLWLTRRAVAEARVNPDAVLSVGEDVVGLTPGLAVEVDVARFEALLRQSPPEIEAALRLYAGDVSPAIRSEVIAATRVRLADMYEDALALVAPRRLAAGDIDGATDAAIELLTRDPLREEAHATLIEMYGLYGSRSQVHRQYRRLQAVLSRELGAEPLPSTNAVYLAALTRTQTERGGGRDGSTAWGTGDHPGGA